MSTHVRTLTRPSTRTHTSVHSCVTRPSTRTLTRTLDRTHVRHHVHLHSSPGVRSPRSLPFYETLKKVKIFDWDASGCPAMQNNPAEKAKQAIGPADACGDQSSPMEFDLGGRYI